MTDFETYLTAALYQPKGIMRPIVSRHGGYIEIFEILGSAAWQIRVYRADKTFIATYTNVPQDKIVPPSLYDFYGRRLFKESDIPAQHRHCVRAVMLGSSNHEHEKSFGRLVHEL